MNKILFRLIFVFALLLGAITIKAQTGSICGTIVDKALNEPLIGASVAIEGTSIGSIADIDGYYRIDNLKPGTYNIEVSYISYSNRKIANLKVVARQETVVNVEMEESQLQLQNITVVAQRKLGTENAVINTIRKSLPIVSGISSQQISKTQDSDAAEVLRRIPGITIVDDRFIIVRGLSQRYNSVWLNNSTTPSSETDSRAFSFDVLPSSLIDNMMVYKSPSPELPADFSGGFVKVNTKNIVDKNSFSVSYQAGYNTEATFREFELSKGHFSDYLGFGAGPRQLKSSSPAHLNDVSVSKAAEFTRENNEGWGIKKFRSTPEQKLALTSTHTFSPGKWKISNIANLNYSNSYSYYDMENNQYISYDMNNDASSYRYKYDDTQYKNTVKLGALFNWSFIEGSNKYEFKNFFNQRGSSSLIQREGIDYYSEENIRKWESIYTGRTTYAGQISGVHTLVEDVQKIDWTAGYSYAAYKEPDRKIVKSLQRTDNDSLKYYVSDPTRYYQNLKDNAISVAGNYEHSLSITEKLKSTLQGGLYGEYKKRDFNARRFVYNLLGNGYNRFADWDYSSIFTDANISDSKIYMKESTNKSDSYNADNILGAVYGMARFNYGAAFTANVGVRVEYYKLKLDGYESDGIKPVHIDNAETQLFPSLNMNYSLNEKNQIRLAYGRSVNRPEFREIVPYLYYDFSLDANITGNINLKNSYCDNLEVRYELYPSNSEMISLGAFYKHFRDPIEQTYSEAGSGLQYTYHNAAKARALGVELDVKKNLGLIGLNDLSLVLNAAYVYSRVSFAKGAFERNRAMQGQSPYLINAGLFYQNDTKNITASLLYNRVGKRIETVGVVAQNSNDDIPDTYEMPKNSLDITLSKQFGKHIELKAGVKNMLNSKTEYKQFLDLTSNDGTKREVTQLIRRYRDGIDFNIGIVFKL